MSGPKAHEVRSALGVDRDLSTQVVLTGTQAAEKPGKHWVDKPNAGYSGTPMWKLALERKEQEDAAAPCVKIPEGFKPTQKGSEWYYSEKRQVFWRTTDGHMYVWDEFAQKHAPLHEAVTFDVKPSVGGCFHDAAAQVRHVMVRDLQKAGTSLRMSLEHLDRPCALYALYEGHRGNPGATGSGNVCAEFCVKNLHLKLLPKLAAFRGYWEDERLQGAMRDSFEELDAEFLDRHASSGKSDGCSAAAALLIGDRVVVSSLGDIACLVCLKTGEASELVKAHAAKESVDEDSEDEEEGGASSSGANQEASTEGKPPIRWTRAFGDAEFKAADSSHRLLATPDVAVVHLQNKHQGVAFVCRALYNAIGRAVAVSTVFRRSAGRPRMAAGALVDAAVQWLGQVTDQLGLGSIVVQFEQRHEASSSSDAPPPQKRARKEEIPSQVRLRHILLKHRECKSTVDKVRNKQVKRSRTDAERLLRAVMEEVLSRGEIDKKVFTQRCKELSECQSSLKSGELVGDLGWVKPGKLGQNFDDTAFSLRVGQLSDLVDSDQGVHVIMRTA